jgi:hypothetical protein
MQLVNVDGKTGRRGLPHHVRGACRSLGVNRHRATAGEPDAEQGAQIAKPTGDREMNRLTRRKVPLRERSRNVMSC